MTRARFGIIVLITAGLGWYAYQYSPLKSGNRVIVETVEAAEKPPQVAEPLAPKNKPRPQSEFYVKPEEIPSGYDGFYELSQMERLNMVTKEMEKTEAVDSDVYAFFKAELFNRNHWDVTRNNMANALVWARNENGLHPDPELHEAFITMLDDETEDPVWRDYCLQFLSENLENSSDPQRVKGVISRYSKGDDSIAGTAMVHMALQEGEGRMELDEGFSDQLAEKLEEPEVHRDTKLAIIGVMGKRKDIKQLPVIRKYARQDENAGLKRVAIAALGIIGASSETRDTITADDRAIIQAGLTHKNRAVQMSAKSALKKMSIN